ncbi:hypothetical protein D623_10032603 [Myotis brandtii]|uniref:Uncharacterized protein n=1 Tax=Myotis brandtii TaxID=109478 RepID=S7PB81_MYOBR|nr:hypothetical protein D623_10032603 [Myotis brandtii]
MEFFSNSLQEHVPCTHPRRPARALGRGCCSAARLWKPEPGVGFQILDWAHRELTVGRNTRETGTAHVLTVRFPRANEHTAQFGDGEQLDHSPPTPKLPRYDSGVVIDTQLYVNFSKTGNKDDDSVQGIGRMCPVGMDSAGFKDSGRWDGMSYHVV